MEPVCAFNIPMHSVLSYQPVREGVWKTRKDPIFFESEFFWTQNYFGPKFFFLTQNIIGPKMSL